MMKEFIVVVLIVTTYLWFCDDRYHSHLFENLQFILENRVTFCLMFANESSLNILIICGELECVNFCGM